MINQESWVLFNRCNDEGKKLFRQGSGHVLYSLRKEGCLKVFMTCSKALISALDERGSRKAFKQLTNAHADTAAHLYSHAGTHLLQS